MKQGNYIKGIAIIAAMSFLLLTAMALGLKKNGRGEMIVDPGNSEIFFPEDNVLVK